MVKPALWSLKLGSLFQWLVVLLAISVPVAKTAVAADSAIVTGLTAFHRSGQTFLTWQEPAAASGYHVYRHTSPITAENLAAATRLTSRWGPLGPDTSVNVHGVDDAPGHFVIADLASPLADDTGLFVHTTKPGQAGPAYYAVVAVVEGAGSGAIRAGSNSLIQPVAESVATAQPVLTRSENGGKGRMYTHYMDYSKWNPTFNGYAYNYAVALPANYNASKSYALAVVLHAYGEEMRFHTESEYGYPVIQLFPSDPGETRQAINSWWYGYSADHNYKTGGPRPTGGYIANFTEQRVIKAIDEVKANPDFNVNPELVYAYGNSMGASGALALGMRYGSVLAGIYANQPMTNYFTSPTFKDDFTRLWGDPTYNLPVVNGGPHSQAIRPYSVDGSRPTGVWNWMNHQKQLVRRRGDSFAYLMVSHGKADETIDWQTQGQPVVKALTAASAGFSASSVATAGHAWLGFVAVNVELFGFGYDDKFPWRYPRSASFPAIQNASGSGPINPPASGDDTYNLNIEWSTATTRFAKPVVDRAGRYEISLRSLDNPQLADITPRNTQQFRPVPGQQCRWSTKSKKGRAKGVVVVDQDALVTVPRITISTGSGTRLKIEC